MLTARFRKLRASSPPRPPPPPPIDRDQPLRLPLELILHIFDTASCLCKDQDARERLHASFRLVNRTFAERFLRTRLNVHELQHGGTLNEVVKDYKKNASKAGGLDGLLIHNPEAAEQDGLAKDWVKLRKSCDHLVHLQLGSTDPSPFTPSHVSGLLLQAMEGISSLSLVKVDLSLSRSPRRFSRTSPNTSIFPPNLRHLCLHSVIVCDLAASTIPVLPPLNQFRLTSLVLVEFALDGAENTASTSDFVHTLLERTAPSLQALHFSRGRDEDPTVLRSRPSELDGISFPSLRIASFPLLLFRRSLLLDMRNLSHLLLNSPGVFARGSPDADPVSAGQVFRSIKEVLVDDGPEGEVGEEKKRTTTSSLQTIVLPVDLPELQDWDMEPWQQVRDEMGNLLEAATKRGVAVNCVDWWDDTDATPEEEFRQTVRKILRERF